MAGSSAWRMRLWVNLQRAQQPAHHRQHQAQRIGCLKHRLLIFLQIFIIRGWQPFQRRQQAGQTANQWCRFSRASVQAYRGSSSAASGSSRWNRSSDSSIKPNSAEEKMISISDKAGKMHPNQRSDKQELRGKIAVGDRIQAVWRNRAKSPGSRPAMPGQPGKACRPARQRPTAAPTARARACASRSRSRTSGQKCASHQWLSKMG